MKIKITILILLFSISISYGQSDILTIIHVNDTHAHVVPWGPKNADGVGTIGGMARMVNIIGTLKATETNPIVLHAGDVMGGDFMFNAYYGVPEFQIMQALGFDAMTIGNHEFNYTPDMLKASLIGAGFPGPFALLSANLDMSADPDLDAFIDDYVIKEYGNTKVGIFGLTTTVTNTIALPAPVVVTDPAPAAVAAVTALTTQGCDIIILLSHLGFLTDQGLAAAIPGIDIIVGGHDHLLVPLPVPVVNTKSGDTTYVLQANWAGSDVGKLTIEVTGQDFKVLDYQMIHVDDSVTEDPITAATVNTLIAGVESDFRYGPVYSQIVASSAALHPKELGKDEFKDTKLGDLITDAIRDTTKTDLAFAANGFVRQDIYAGNLTEADIFQVIPEGLDFLTGYGSGVSTFELDGRNVPVALEFSVALIEYSDTFFLNASGITFDFNSHNQPGTRVDYTSIRIDGQPLNVSSKYTAAINSDLVALLGLTGIDTIYNVQKYASSEYTVLRDYIIKNSPIDHPGGNRVRDVALTQVSYDDNSDQLPLKYFIDQNYPNPFNPTTTIDYVNPIPGNVRISIFNTLGQEISVLTNKFHDTGNYSVIWNGKDKTGNKVSSGVYFYRLKAGKAIMARKMIMSK